MKAYIAFVVACCLAAALSPVVAATPTIAPIQGTIALCPGGKHLQQKVVGSKITIVCAPNLSPLSNPGHVVTPTYPPKVYKTPKPIPSNCRKGLPSNGLTGPVVQCSK